MPSYHVSGLLWQPWMLLSYIVVDLFALGVLLLFHRHWVSWIFAAAVGVVPFVSLYMMSR